jgi:hypothetical protein
MEAICVNPELGIMKNTTKLLRKGNTHWLLSNLDGNFVEGISHPFAVLNH